MPLLASNFTSNLLYGTTIVAGGWANVDLQVDAFAFEGDKTFVVKLRKDSILGQVIGTSLPITIKDYTGIVSLTANAGSPGVDVINEGSNVQYTLITTNVVNYTNVAYSVLPITANVTPEDFVADTGYVTIINNVGVFELQLAQDLSLMDENGETWQVQIRDKNNTNVYVSANISTDDLYRGVNTLRFIESAATTAEGGTITLTFTATNADRRILYYTTDGNATTSTFAGGNTGSFVMGPLSNTITLLPVGVPFGTTQNFTVQVRTDSITGPVIATSNNLIVLDSSIAFMNVSGGTITDAGGYRIHAFTTSGNLTINSLGASPTQNLLDYLIVAGGGAGGGGGSNFGNPYAYAGGGGGGAGGLLTSNLILPTGNTVITIGAGGAAVGPGTPAYNRPGFPGGNTIVIFAGGTTLTSFGGGGGSGGDVNTPPGFGIGRPGGSGGGTTTVNNYGTPTVGSGVPGQGNPGGKSSALNYGGAAAGGEGGGGGGAGEAGHYQPTDPISPLSTTTQAGGNGLPISWAPPAYGTAGPAPGRYFAGGGGGGGWPGGSAFILSGGAGGGGAGGFYPPGYPTAAFNGSQDHGANALINTGGGGGGIGSAGGSVGPSRSGTGGSGIVIIRYPYIPSPTVTNVITTASAFIVGSNITFTINTLNANTLTWYYSTEGNVDASYFIGGNTGSFVANASGAVFTLRGNTSSTVPVGQTRNFRMRIRQDSTTGYISGSSSNIALLNSADYYISATGGDTVFLKDGYKIHTYNASSIFNVTGTGGTGAIEYLVLAGGGGGGSGYPGFGGAGAGGGAGGYLVGSATLPATGSYIITVGAGGAQSSLGNRGGDGGLSNIFGPGLSIQAAGGGGGGATPAAGQTSGNPGGSGGGSTAFSAGTGTPGQGYPGGTAYNLDYTGGGGGAGGAASPVGAPNSYSSTGGPGATSSITGTSVVRGGGGTGGRGPAAGAGSPPAGGGGGAGGFGGSPSPTAGVVNSGGGGGGASVQNIGSAGGSGIVIIRYPYV